jgi:hypothetical protein
VFIEASKIIGEIRDKVVIPHNIRRRHRSSLGTPLSPPIDLTLPPRVLNHQFSKTTLHARGRSASFTVPKRANIYE